VNQDILIVGGYGVVGSRIARELTPEYAGRLIIAGRSAERAQGTAALIGHGTRGRVIDVEDPASIEAALEGVAVAVNCIDQPRRLLLSAVLERGSRYTDITPHLVQLGRGTAFEKIDARARASGACVVLGTGIVPGISNVMVRALADALGGADEIETSLLLDARDISGPASLEYFLQEVAMTFDVHIDGSDLRKRAFSEPRLIQYPPPVGARQSYLFPFSDQVLYPRSMGARTVITRLALDPPWLAGALGLLSRSGVARLLAAKSIRRLFARGRHDRHGPGAPFALRVDVGHHGRSRHATLVGQTQAHAAALGAAGVARLLAAGQVHEAGAWMPDQVVEPAPFLAWLAARGLKVEL
jgi:saccharopine dehydrogenase-like NADP-dependent oxidoreductase